MTLAKSLTSAYMPLSAVMIPGFYLPSTLSSPVKTGVYSDMGLLIPVIQFLLRWAQRCSKFTPATMYLLKHLDWESNFRQN